MASTTSLLNSAASTRAQLADYQDRLMAFQYSNSAYTESAFDEYSKYLQKRIDSLTTTGGVSNASKALSLTENLRTATKQNMSSSIQRENIQIMAGNASLTDKYNLVASQFVRAQSIGDDTLAQSLMSQAYSLSQSIQLQAQQAADAATTNAKANAGSDKALAQNLTDELKQFNDDYAHAGQKTATKLVGDFVDKMKPTLQTLGIHLQDGVQPNYFDIVDGVNRAIFQSYTNAGLAVAPYDTGTAQDYYDKATATKKNIPTIYGTMNVAQLASAAANPNQFSYKEDPDFVGSNGNKGIGGKQNAQIGYNFSPKNGITPAYASSPWITVPTQLNNQAQALGLQTIAKSDNTLEVTPTNDSPDWLKKILPNNSTVNIVGNPNGQLSFEADARDGSGKALYTIAKDNTVWESTGLADTMIFDPNPKPTTQGEGFWGRFGGAVKSGVTDIGNDLVGGAMSLFSGHASAMGFNGSSMLANATSHYTLPPLPMASAPHQTVSLAPVSGPRTVVAPPPRPQPIQAPTYNPQQPSTAPIQGGNSPQQTGGGFNLNQSGGGWSMRL